MKMKAVGVMFCLCICLGIAYGRLTVAELRSTLTNINPVFSHDRGKAVPFMQNVNIKMPMASAAVQSTNDRISNASPTNELPSNARPVTSEARVNNRLQNTRPATSEARVNSRPQNTRPATSEARVNSRPSNTRPVMSGARTSGLGSPVQQKRRLIPVPAGKPRRQQGNVLGQIKPTRIEPTPPVRVPVNAQANNQRSRPVPQPSTNNARPTANVASSGQQTAASKKKCAFQIPSFLLPGEHRNNIDSSQTCPSFLLPGPNINPELITHMVKHWANISNNENPSKNQFNGVRSQLTQVELEQKCLLPALRAHILGGPACKTRELKVYLEWLLDLRKKLFRI